MNKHGKILEDIQMLGTEDLYELALYIARNDAFLADQLSLNLETALREVEDEYDADPGSMDGDHESGLASAGWGTDEDYNGYDYGDEY